MQQRIDEYAEMHGFSAWFATSAKENYGFKDAVDFVSDLILQNGLQPARLAQVSVKSRKDKPTWSCSALFS